MEDDDKVFVLLALSQTCDVQGSVGGYTERILTWFCSHCPAVCICCFPAVRVPGADLPERSRPSATHSFSISPGADRPFPATCDKWALAQAREKQKKRARPKCEAGAVRRSPPKSETSSKAVIRKDEHFIRVQSPAFIHIASDFCNQPWHRQCGELGVQKLAWERDEVDRCFCSPETCSLKPQNLRGLTSVGHSMCFMALQLVLTEVKTPCPSEEVRTPELHLVNAQHHSSYKYAGLNWFNLTDLCSSLEQESALISIWLKLVQIVLVNTQTQSNPRSNKCL